MDLSGKLEALIARLEAAWAPFAESPGSWKGDPEGLEALAQRRDAALQAAAPLLVDFGHLWKAWEDSRPSTEERSRVFASRNRLVELGLAASRNDSALQEKARRRVSDLRRQAADSGRRSRASRAYLGGRAGV